jgi:predicted nucleotidyltransferase
MIRRRLGPLPLGDTARVGFPRDGDHRAAWSKVHYDDTGRHAAIHRVPYDMEAVAVTLKHRGRLTTRIDRAACLRADCPVPYPHGSIADRRVDASTVLHLLHMLGATPTTLHATVMPHDDANHNEPSNGVPRSTAEVQNAEVLTFVAEVPGPDVVGAYLHGSPVLGGLRARSDIDILVVSRRPTTRDEKRRLVNRLLIVSSVDPAGLRRPVELTVVVQSRLRPWRYPPNFDFQYGDWLRREFESCSPSIRRRTTRPVR